MLYSDKNFLLISDDGHFSAISSTSITGNPVGGVDANGTIYFPPSTTYPVTLTFAVNAAGDGSRIAFSVPENCKCENEPNMSDFSIEGNNPYTFTYNGGISFADLVTFWDFGDGETSFNSTATHKYKKAGTYTVCFKKMVISEVDQVCCGQSCQTVIVTEEQIDQSCQVVPNFDFSVANSVVEFDNTSTYNSTAKFVWIFGDGKTSTQTNPIHSYASDGEYTVCLAVFATSPSGENCCDRICRTVTIGSPEELTLIKTTSPSQIPASQNGQSVNPKNIQKTTAITSKEELTLIPNPSTGLFTVQYKTDGKADTYYLNIISPKGEVIRKQKLTSSEGTVSLDISNLAPNTYHVNITAGNKTISSQKLILAK
ncbi:MAG: PKD domain-containing protein [Bacteroidota bacterium]